MVLASFGVSEVFPWRHAIVLLCVVVVMLLARASTLRPNEESAAQIYPRQYHYSAEYEENQWAIKTAHDHTETDERIFEVWTHTVWLWEYIIE